MLRCSTVGYLFWVLYTVPIVCFVASHYIHEAVYPASADDESQEHTCRTEACVSSARDIASSLDCSVDPCEDFYSFACGGWVKNNPSPEDQREWTSLSKLAKENNNIVKKAIESIDKEHAPWYTDRLVREYYDSCMDVTGFTEALGEKPLKQLIAQLGGWNMSPTGFLVDQFDLQFTLQELKRYNLWALIDWSVQPDDNNSSNHIISISVPNVAFPEYYFYSDRAYKNALDNYANYMTSVASLLGGDEKDVQEQIKDVVEFETRYSTLSNTDPLEIYTEIKNPTTIKELQATAPFINWKEYFNSVFKLARKSVSDDEMVIVQNLDALVKLNDVINEYMNTDKGKTTLNNHIIWNAIKSMYPYLSKAFRDAADALQKVLYGSRSNHAWEACISDTNEVFGDVTFAFFVNATFSGQTKRQIEEMVQRIKENFDKDIEASTWMDATTKEQTALKARTLAALIGYPDYIVNGEELDQQYADVKLNPGRYLWNRMEMKKHQLRKNLRKLGQPVDGTEWEPSQISPESNAMVDFHRNLIVISGGILKLPFFHSDRLDSLNYGGIGTVIGHEISHGFDPLFRVYDRFGNKIKWWDDKSIEEYNNRTECFMDQYDQFSEYGIRNDGALTIGGAIADNGFKAAYEAYLELTNSSSEMTKLPGLKYNDRQLFFISLAQIFCGSVTKEYFINYVKMRNHSWYAFRVTAMLQNMPEFSKEFQCPVGSKMNPANKCSLF